MQRTKLLDPAKALELGRVNDLDTQRVNFYVAVDGVVEHLKAP